MIIYETLLNHLKQGWALVDEIWTYASPTTINVPSGALSRFAKGGKLKLDNTTTKYLSIVNVADTLLTVTGGSDYSVANLAISNIYYSCMGNPIGFPKYFNFTPTFVNLTIGSGSVKGIIKITNNGEFIYRGGFIFGSGSSVGDSYITLPTGITLYTLGGSYGRLPIGLAYFIDAGIQGYLGQISDDGRICNNGAGGTYVTGYNGLSSTIPFTWGTGDTISWHIQAPIA